MLCIIKFINLYYIGIPTTKLDNVGKTIYRMKCNRENDLNKELLYLMIGIVLYIKIDNRHGVVAKLSLNLNHETTF